MDDQHSGEQDTNVIQLAYFDDEAQFRLTIYQQYNDGEHYY